MTAIANLLVSSVKDLTESKRSGYGDWAELAGYRRLFYAYYPALCEKANSIVSCRYQAEEIVSDVFIKIWMNREELCIKSSIKAYLYRAVRNQSIDHLRRLSRRKVRQEKMPISTDATNDSPEDQLLFCELDEYVQATIRALPPRGQHIFRLSREEGLKYQEIADLLGISIKTVETHMRRSLIFLRSRLKGNAQVYL